MSLFMAVCLTWLLTATCADDVLFYTPPDAPDFDEVCAFWGGTNWQCERTLPINIGCFEGTVRLVSRDTAGNEGEPIFLYWEADPGRLMDIDCRDGGCIQPTCP